MITQKTYHLVEIWVAVVLMAAVAFISFGAASIHAQTGTQTNFNPPVGYQSVIGYPGVYFNTSSGLYFYSSNGIFTPNSPAIPSGYQPFGNYGAYYNSNTGMYYNPVSGQYSNIMPLGPASLNSSGSYIIPAGYTLSTNGSFYNSSTGLYYDPRTGFYSSTAPLGPVAAPVVVTTTTTTTTGGTTYYNPGLPNTGAGGEASTNMAFLMVTGIASIAGLTVLGRRLFKA